MEKGVGENDGVCSTETGNQGEDVYTSKDSDALSADHLVVMVHGILGSASDWKFGAEQFVQRLPDKVFVHYDDECQLEDFYALGVMLYIPFFIGANEISPTSQKKVGSERNAAKLTLDGVDIMGERLAEEVLEVIKKKPSLKKISFVAHSVGGLVARYAIGKLYRPPNKGSGEEVSANGSIEESKGTIANLEPINFITVATPHLGSRGNKQVPFLFGVTAFEKVAGCVIHLIFRRTGRHLFLTDDDEGKPPLLKRMVEDNDECCFMSAIRSFQRRVAYSNVGYDLLSFVVLTKNYLDIVGWRTSSIRRNSELPKKYKKGGVGLRNVIEPQLLFGWEDSVDDKYPHVVYEERCKAYDNEQCDTTVEDNVLDELEGKTLLSA
ncbi:hypothetical protein OROGR_011194 [Orobanche gracilis]